MAKTKKSGSMYSHILYYIKLLELSFKIPFLVLDKTKISPYNKFMKTELPKARVDIPEITHREALKIVAQRWKESPDNPKNAREPFEDLSDKQKNVQEPLAERCEVTMPDDSKNVKPLTK
jgi:hypothetical protein